jgi:hypothetical protein
MYYSLINQTGDNTIEFKEKSLWNARLSDIYLVWKSLQIKHDENKKFTPPEHFQNLIQKLLKEEKSIPLTHK